MDMARLLERMEDDAGVRDALEARWRNDAAVVAGLAGAVLVAGRAESLADAMNLAQEAWFSLLDDPSFAKRAAALPGDSAVEALRLQLLPGSGLPSGQGCR